MICLATSIDVPGFQQNLAGSPHYGGIKGVDLSSGVGEGDVSEFWPGEFLLPFRIFAF
jgi:hypothetical protein